MEGKPEEATTPERRPFAAWLREQRQGGLHADLSDTLAEVVSAAIEHQKVGKLTLTLTVQPTGDGSVFVGDVVQSKVPEAEQPRSLFFADERGNLSRRDPRQAELPLREVPGADKSTPEQRKATG